MKNEMNDVHHLLIALHEDCLTKYQYLLITNYLQCNISLHNIHSYYCHAIV